ncbi:MAG: hypothetical protein FJZ56_03625 [Chlamydiae bacterium]|nr:hypothetical protein [Chlamydiota bacterium]
MYLNPNSSEDRNLTCLLGIPDDDSDTESPNTSRESLSSDLSSSSDKTAVVFKGIDLVLPYKNFSKERLYDTFTGRAIRAHNIISEITKKSILSVEDLRSIRFLGFEYADCIKKARECGESEVDAFEEQTADSMAETFLSVCDRLDHPMDESSLNKKAPLFDGISKIERYPPREGLGRWTSSAISAYNSIADLSKNSILTKPQLELIRASAVTYLESIKYAEAEEGGTSLKQFKNHTLLFVEQAIEETNETIDNPRKEIEKPKFIPKEHSLGERKIKPKNKDSSTQTALDESFLTGNSRFDEVSSLSSSSVKMQVSPKHETKNVIMDGISTIPYYEMDDKITDQAVYDMIESYNQLGVIAERSTDALSLEDAKTILTLAHQYMLSKQESFQSRGWNRTCMIGEIYQSNDPNENIWWHMHKEMTPHVLKLVNQAKDRVEAQQLDPALSKGLANVSHSIKKYNERLINVLEHSNVLNFVSVRHEVEREIYGNY